MEIRDDARWIKRRRKKDKDCKERVRNVDAGARGGSADN